MEILAIRDVKANSFGKPFPAASIIEVQRGLSTVLNDQNKTSDIQKYPEDFDLFHIGSFDDVSGKVTPLPNAEYVANLKSFVKE